MDKSRNALMEGYFLNDMGGYTPDQAYGGRFRDPAYSSGAAGTAIAPWEILGPAGLGAAGGAFAGRAMARGGATLADILFPYLAGTASAGVGRAAGALGGAVGGAAGGMAGYDVAVDRRLSPQMPPVPMYPRRPPEME